MTGKLVHLFSVALRQKDVIMVLMFALILLMIILPLPEVLIDILITINISASILVLLTSLQLRSTSNFSTFPSLLLFTTLYRLAISISTTRLILVDGSAGQIVRTFGEVVVGGNLVVGLVIFLIITLVQFLVITKGADRVAEVGARFTLDGMPGKQMSVDADVRAGNLDHSDARQARQHLELEAKLFGSMDGAMKFVKGDATAGMAIIVVNLLGGILIGVMQRGLPFGEALQHYSLLTVGDGLVAQIPALMISVAAGNIVTRITKPQGMDLGAEISQQLFSNRRTIFVSGVVIAAFGLIPGFPFMVFLTIGLLLTGWVLGNTIQDKKNSTLAEQDWSCKQRLIASICELNQRKTGAKETLRLVLPTSITTVQVSYFWQALEGLRSSIEKEFGISAGYWTFEIGTHSENYQIFIKQNLVATGKFLAGSVFVKAHPTYLRELDIACHTDFGVREGGMVDESFIPKLREEKIEFWTPAEQLLLHIKGTLISRLEDLADIQSIDNLIVGVRRSNAVLVNDLNEALSRQQINQVFRFLLRERIPVTNCVPILEAILEAAGRRADPYYILQKARLAIGDFITRRFAPDGFLIVIVIAPTLESFIREGIRPTEEGTFLILEPSICRQIASRAREVVGEGFKRGEHPVFITQQDIRYTLHSVLHEHGIYLPVLAYQEVSPNTVVYPVDYLSVDQ
ncbi:FHIPEP family type III secretion protein [Brucella intermedia]|uniref:FHIPEP family type III secretion protein n=1 Tax=Brucella intermedia TaxID=94625 RepID=UPI00235FFEC8|nr:flagellar biosynthesis protein FlhA [Brucella intermedia]